MPNKQQRMTSSLKDLLNNPALFQRFPWYNQGTSEITGIEHDDGDTALVTIADTSVKLPLTTRVRNYA